MSTPRRIGMIRVSHELLRDALALPDNMDIWAVYPSTPSDPTREAMLHVTSPDLPEVAWDEKMPVLDVTFTADYEKRPATWITCDLGLEKGKDKPK